MMKNEEGGRHEVYVEDSPVPRGSKIIHQSGTVPEGAVYISRKDVLNMQTKIIENWRPRLDMWPFTYGVGMIAGVTIGTGAAYNSYYRRKLKLFKYKSASTLLAACLVPALTAVTVQVKSIMEPILLREIECPSCIATRAATAQMTVAGIQTPILSYLSCSTVATLGFRYTFPSITDVSAWLKKAQSLTKPFGTSMLLITLVNGWFAAVLAYRQQKAAVLVQQKLFGQLETQSSVETDEEQELDQSH